MNEIYWITRLDGIQAFFAICTILAALAIVFLFINILVLNEEYEKTKSQKWLKKLFCSLPFFVLPLIFIPSTKDALLIYGLGGSLDYVKGNDTAKKLPEKAVMALDKYLEELSKDKKEK